MTRPSHSPSFSSAILVAVCVCPLLVAQSTRSANAQQTAAQSVEILPQNAAQKSRRITASPQSASISAAGKLVGQVQFVSSSGMPTNVIGQVYIVDAMGAEAATLLRSNGTFAIYGLREGVHDVYVRIGDALLVQSVRLFRPSPTAGLESNEKSLKMFAALPVPTEAEAYFRKPVERDLSEQFVWKTRPADVDEFGSRVRLVDGNVLQGQVWSRHPSVDQTEIVIFRDGERVGRTMAGPEGKFSLPLEPGRYGLIASGRAGYACVGFEAMETESQSSGTLISTNVEFVQFEQTPASGMLDVGLVSNSPALMFERQLPTRAVPTAAVGGGGFGGAGAGAAGGAAGGLGSLGGLAAIGAVAAGVAASQDDDVNSFPPTQTPIASASGQ
jgi:hypothetical protein